MDDKKSVEQSKEPSAEFVDARTFMAELDKPENANLTFVELYDTAKQNEPISILAREKNISADCRRHTPACFAALKAGTKPSCPGCK